MMNNMNFAHCFRCVGNLVSIYLRLNKTDKVAGYWEELHNKGLHY